MEVNWKSKGNEMEVNFGQNETAPAVHQVAVGKPSRSKGRRTSRTGTSNQATSLGQVTLNVERAVLAQFDEITAQTGVNRQHLMREALKVYAALLQSGHRVFEIPGLGRRVA